MKKQDLINFESKIVELYKDCKLPFLFHLSGGNEDQLIEIFKDIRSDDYVLSSHRNHYHALLHGITPEKLQETILNGRSMFVFDRKRNFFTSSIIGGTPAIAVGIALALKRKNSSQKVWCFVGDGTEDTGHFWEAARYVDGFGLPCKFIVEDNNRSVVANKKERWGTATDPIFPSCVKRYKYQIIWPHARSNDIIDLSKTQQLTHEDYFPLLPPEKLSNTTTNNHIKYSEAINYAMENIAKHNGIFIGYNVLHGNAMGALKNVSDNQKIETPVTENLMMGIGIGMSFEGYRPVIYFERHDFMMVAADSIVNHLNYIERISHGEYNCPVIIRSIVADSGPFYSGLTHSQDFTEGFKKLIDFPIYQPTTGNEVLNNYNKAIESQRPSMIVERKSCYV
jgi:deoxyxylulose-5-phosphate synthase